MVNSSPTRPQESDWRVWAVVLGLVLGTFAAYAQVIHFGFVNFDDRIYVADNPDVQHGFTPASFAWAFTSGYASNWHPLTWLSHMLDCLAFGLSPGAHHVTSLLFHAANSVLLFWVLRRMTGALWRSALVAALFAWHPLHVESVAWIAERKDVLSTFFWLLTLLAWVRYVEQPGPRRYGFALVCYALGLMSKPMLVTLPFLLVVLDWWPLQRISARGVSGAAADDTGWPKLIREKIPFLVLAGVSCVVTFIVQQKGGAVTSMQVIPLARRAANIPVAYVTYLRKMFWPSDLSAFYPLPGAWPAIYVTAAVIILAVITLAAIRLARPMPWLLAGWLWYLGTLVPVVGVVQVGLQSMADRYTYMPLVGIFIIVSWGAADLLARLRLPEKAGSAVAVPVLAACLVLTRAQAAYWRDSESLFRHALALDPDNPVALAGVAADLTRAGNVSGAILCLQSAVASQPDYADAHYNLGNALAVSGRFDEAATQYTEALRLNPRAADAHNNLGSMDVRLGRPDEAMAQFEAAIAVRPDFPEAQDALASLCLNKGRLDEARAHAAEALRLRPDFIHARLLLADILARQRDYPASISAYRQLLQLQPDTPSALSGLAWILATNPEDQLRNGAEALRLARHARELLAAPNPRVLASLDAALAEAGQFDEAIKVADQARQLAATSGQNDLANQAARRLESYRAGKPWRE